MERIKCVIQSPTAPRQQDGVLISVHWLTTDAQTTGLIDLKASIRACGWTLLQAASWQEPDCSYRGLLTVAPYLSPYISEKGAFGPTRQMRLNLLNALRRFENGQGKDLLSLTLQLVLIVPG